MPLRKLEKSDWRYYSAHLSKSLANRRSEANTASLRSAGKLPRNGCRCSE